MIDESTQPQHGCEKLYVTSFDKHRIEFSNGAVITSDKGEFDIDIIEAIMRAGK